MSTYRLSLSLLLLCFSVYEAFILDDNCQDCHWNGVCNTQSARCQCYSGFKGADCSIDCGCKGHGHCNHDNTCKCDHGWKWSDSQHMCVWDCSCVNGTACMGPGICGCTNTCVSGTCWNGQCECWEGYSGSTCSRFDPSIMMNKDVNVGVNLGALSYWSPELKFVDVCKQSMEWITERAQSHQWDTHEHDNVTWRPDGYPASLPKTMEVGKLVLRAGAGVHGPQGNFTLLYDGDGEVVFRLTRYTVHYNGKGRMVVEFHENKDGIFVMIRRTNPDNPIRNIRLIMPGFEDRHALFPFYPPFLENIKRYSEIRFMDFFHTNDHGPEPTTWRSRRLPTFHTQTGNKGAAIEYAVHLVNLIGADPWFNLPHAADNDFNQQFAIMANTILRTDRKVYIEYSNEVWNGIFRQTHYTREQGLAAVLDSNDGKAGMKYYNKRATEVVDIWRNVYTNHLEKLVPVWAWQTGYQDYTKQAIEDLGARISHFGAIGITGYFSCDKATYKHNITMLSFTQLAQLCKDDVPRSVASFQHYMDIAKIHNVKLLMYEGGPGLESSRQHDDQVTEQAVNFNRHGLMEQVVTDVLEAWYNVTNTDVYNSHPGGLFNYFSSVSAYNKYGSWGMLEYTGQDPYTAPKYLAMHKYISHHYNDQYYGSSCTFVQADGQVFGCFSLGKRPVCGHSANNGLTWQHYPEVSTSSKVNMLDGYDPRTRDLFVRSVDSLAVNKYFVLNTGDDAPTWTKLSVADYHARLAPASVLRHQPVGGTSVNTANLDCN